MQRYRGLLGIEEINLNLRREGDVIRAKRTEKESERGHEGEGKGRRVSVVEEGGRFQSGYIGIYITLLASIFENGAPAELVGITARSCILLLMAPGMSGEFSSRSNGQPCGRLLISQTLKALALYKHIFLYLFHDRILIYLLLAHTRVFISVLQIFSVK